MEGLGARIEQVQVEAVGDEEARRLLSDLRDELAELRSGAAAGAADSEQLLAAAQEAREAAALRETQSAVERLAQGAEEAVELARGHSTEASDAAGAVADGWRAPSRPSTPIETEARRAQQLEGEAAGRSSWPARRWPRSTRAQPR